MRGFGILMLAGFSLLILFLVSTGCEDEKKEVCCKCTCYVLDDASRDVIAYTGGTNISCSAACRTECVDKRTMLSRDPATIECETMPTDN